MANTPNPPPSLPEVLDSIRAKDPRYPVDAYSFLLEVMDDAVKTLLSQDSKHVKQLSAAELLDGIRRYAVDEFGPMAYTVFNEWNIHQTTDFGNIVYNLIDAGRLGASATDRRTDFDNVYTFDEAFLKPFQPPLTAAESRAASRGPEKE